MTRLIISAIFLTLFLTSTALSQNLDAKLIRWSDKSTCGKLNFTLSEQDVLECDYAISNDKLIRYAYFNGIFVAVALLRDDNYAVADIYLSNDSGSKILVEPRTWMTVNYKTLEDSTILSVESSIPPDKVAKKFEGGFGWKDALAAFAAGMATKSSTVYSTGNIYDSRGNSSVYSGQSTITTPDYEAQEKARKARAARTAKASAKAENIRSRGLRANTVSDQGYVAGLVFFKRNKKSKHGIFVLEIGAASFVFDFL